VKATNACGLRAFDFSLGTGLDQLRIQIQADQGSALRCCIGSLYANQERSPIVREVVVDGRDYLDMRLIYALEDGNRYRPGNLALESIIALFRIIER